MQDSYAAHLPMSLTSYEGSVLEAFQREHACAQTQMAQRGIYRAWWDYKGDAASAFVAYTRWQPKRLSLAALYGIETRTGLMDTLWEAMTRIAYEHHLSLRFEAISNPHLVCYLRRRACKIASGTELMPDMVWDQSS